MKKSTLINRLMDIQVDLVNKEWATQEIINSIFRVELKLRKLTKQTKGRG